MTSESETKFELLSLAEQESALNQYGCALSRREDSGFVVSLIVWDNQYYEVYFYMRSHETVKIEMISREQAFLQYKDLQQVPFSKVA